MNRIIHFEVHARDMDKMQAFYSTVFGWKLTDLGPQMGHYRMIQTGSDAPGEKWPGIDGGMNPRRGELPAEGQPLNAYVCTIGVDDLDAYMAKVLAAGGTLATEKMPIPGVGSLAYARDIEGNIFGIMQADR